jgi:hypothetical protein
MEGTSDRSNQSSLGLRTILYTAYGHILTGERQDKNCCHLYHKKCLGGADGMVWAKIQLFMVWYGMSLLLLPSSRLSRSSVSSSVMVRFEHVHFAEALHPVEGIVLEGRILATWDKQYIMFMEDNDSMTYFGIGREDTIQVTTRLGF